MPVNKLPPLNVDDNPTDCCPRFDPDPWDDKKFVFDKKKFVKANTVNFLHIPLNMGSVIKKTWKAIMEAKANDPKEFAMLSYDVGAWCGEHYLTVTKKVPGLNNTTLSGTFLTKVFEGDFKEAPMWCQQMEQFVKSKNKEIKKIYFYYTTCPKCAKIYGKNYVVCFAQI